MSEYICPFSATLSKDDFACQHAQKIIRRGGEEFACQYAAMHGCCSDLYAKVRPVALKALDLEDDLLTLPHSVLVKIQFGCLLGLQADNVKEAAVIENIAALIGAITNNDELPFDQINAAINQYKPPKRRRK